MATTEAQLIEEGQENEDSLSVEDELQEVQQKVQTQKRKCLNRGICIGYTLCLLAVVIVIYYSMTRGGCGEGPNICGSDSIMDQKQHGTCIHSVQDPLRWDCNRDTADRICCFNRDYAEYAGYWETTSFLDEVDRDGITTFYDSVTGKPLFKAPIGRSFDDFRRKNK